MTSLDKAQDRAPQSSPAARKPPETPRHATPAAGAHAADHLTNEDATPGAGALTSPAHKSGKEVDGGAG